MSSSREILFRIRQEAWNLMLLAFPPRLSAVPLPAQPLSPFPDPVDVARRLEGTAFSPAVTGLAEQILRHQVPLLGLTLETGPEIHWRRDYLSSIETGAVYFRRIPYLEPRTTGDHKIVWELNRHQHLVLLAQSFLISGKDVALREIVRQLESWMEANPMQRGINWASALEVAFRALSWIWIEHLTGAHFEPAFRARFLAALYRHGVHLEHNLSVYFSPNTHLLGEAVALHALGRLFPWFPAADRWRRHGAQVVREQMAAQVHPDGSHFEQSTYYHVYALDMFLFHAILERPPHEFLGSLERMAGYLHALHGPAEELAFLGDDDGGRFFHPYGIRNRFGRATLATCGVFLNRPEWVRSKADLEEQAAWWLAEKAPAKTTRGVAALNAQPAESPLGSARTSPRTSQRFEDAGMAVLTSGGNHILFDGGPFGIARAGHSHSDTLAITVSADGREILIDPGTYSYMDPVWRSRFRGSAAHNTVRVNQADQAVSLSPFAWTRKPEVRWREWTSDDQQDIADAECSYGGIVHRRRLRFVKPDLLFLIDEISGPAGQFTVEQFWHPGSPDARSAIFVEAPAEWSDGGEFAWRSTAFAAKTPSPILCVRRRTALPCRLAAAVVMRPGIACEIRPTAFGSQFIAEGKSYTVDLLARKGRAGTLDSAL